MVGESVRTALETLQSEKARIVSAISALEGLLGSKVSPKKARRRAGGLARRKAAGPKAPRGLLRQKMHQVLRIAGKPLAPAELRNRVLKSGYPSKSPKNLYVAIFAAAKKDPRIKKTAKGYTLK